MVDSKDPTYFDVGSTVFVEITDSTPSCFWVHGLMSPILRGGEGEVACYSGGYVVDPFNAFRSAYGPFTERVSRESASRTV